MANKKPNEPAQDEEQQAQPDPQETAQPGQQERKLDHAPNGGRYIVNGVLVDANGQPVKDNK